MAAALMAPKSGGVAGGGSLQHQGGHPEQYKDLGRKMQPRPTGTWFLVPCVCFRGYQTKMATPSLQCCEQDHGEAGRHRLESSLHLIPILRAACQ